MFFDKAPYGLFQTDSTGKVTKINNALAGLLGFNEKQPALTALQQSKIITQSGMTLSQIIRERVTETSCQPIHFAFKRASQLVDAVLFPWEANFDDETVFAGLILNLTDINIDAAENSDTNIQFKNWINEFEQTNRESQLMLRFGGLVNHCASIPEILDVLANSIGELYPHLSGALLERKSSESTTSPNLTVRSQWGNPLPPNGNHARDIITQFERWNRTEKHGDKLSAESLPNILEHNNHISMPIIANQQLMGGIVLYGKVGHNKQHTHQVLSIIGEYASIAMTNLILRHELRRQALHDPLTGLLNRRGLDDILQQIIYEAIREKTQISMMMIDIDRFKHVNDTYGHEVGDYILRVVSKTLKSRLRRSDVICRWGGDEMLIVLPKCSRDFAIGLANELQQIISNQEFYYNGEKIIQITLSIGVAIFPDNSADVDALIQTADAALYRAKNSGRNQAVIETKPRATTGRLTLNKELEVEDKSYPE
ncbi:MAG: GGDEF domain-containing protein [Anaerolineaceae bacterium]|nr:GGDEF domain-containing protein [Anaerolineaceae bacterium]